MKLISSCHLHAKQWTNNSCSVTWHHAVNKCSFTNFVNFKKCRMKAELREVLSCIDKR